MKHMNGFDIFMGVLGVLYFNALLLWVGLGWLVLSTDEDIFARIIGLFWLAGLAYIDVFVLFGR